MKKRGGPTGLRRADRSRFPYEPRVVGGKLMSPVELQRLRRFILDTAVIEAISDEMRAVVEAVWPELGTAPLTGHQFGSVGVSRQSATYDGDMLTIWPARVTVTSFGYSCS